MINRRNILKALGLLAIPTNLLFGKTHGRTLEITIPKVAGTLEDMPSSVSVSIDNGKWYHIAITRNEKSYKFYLDEVKIGEVKNKGQGYEHTKWFCNEIKNKTNKLI